MCSPVSIWVTSLTLSCLVFSQCVKKTFKHFKEGFLNPNSNNFRSKHLDRFSLDISICAGLFVCSRCEWVNIDVHCVTANCCLLCAERGKCQYLHTCVRVCVLWGDNSRMGSQCHYHAIVIAQLNPFMLTQN